MQVESIIRKTLSIKGFKLGKGRLVFDKVLVIPIQARKGRRPRCPVCGKRGPIYDTQKERTWRHCTGFDVNVLLEYSPRRVKCRNCRKIRTEEMPWNIGKCHLTRPFLNQLAAWARELSWKQVSDLFRVDWSQVQLAVKTAVEYGLAKRDISNVSLIGIDEISRRKGHTYLTQVYEIAEGHRRLLWSGEGRSKETLRTFFKYWGEERCKRIEGVCCDVWNPYIDVISEFAPQAILVFDKFHIIRHLNEAVNDVRKQEKSEVEDELINRTFYIWLKRPWNLTESQEIKLKQLESKKLKTHRAYCLKEAFFNIWIAVDIDEAYQIFKSWFWWATHSRLQPIRELAWKLRSRIDKIISYINLPINNSIVEGMNNKAKVIMRRAFGYAKPHLCKLALLHCMGGLELPEV